MSRSRAVPAVLAAVALAACGDVITPNARSGAPSGPSQVTFPDQAELARQIPEFGGYFLDEQGVPTVWLTDVEAKGEAQNALAGFARSRGVLPTGIRVRQGAYSYAQLDDWHSRVAPVWEHAGVVFTDLDEANNTVLIGVENSALADVILATLERARVPRSAVQIREVEPIQIAATLRDVIRPVQAGMQIHYGNYVCTLGFNATHSQGRSYITNSHCSGTQGGVQGTVHYQPLSPNRIGVEVADPEYFTGGVCPKGKKCRYSDSSRGLYDGTVLSAQGLIARPINRTSTGGSLTIDALNPTFSISGEQGSAVVGQTVDKIGRTTGWTSGQITNTCVNTSVQGSKVMQLCQVFVSAGVAGGDSGSPVFSWGGSGNNVTLRGILWGGSSSTFVYSPINQVEDELGALGTS